MFAHGVARIGDWQFLLHLFHNPFSKKRSRDFTASARPEGDWLEERPHPKVTCLKGPVNDKATKGGATWLTSEIREANGGTIDDLAREMRAIGIYV